MNVTVQSIMKTNEMEYAEINALLRAGVKAGIVKQAGKAVKKDGQRGKSATVYEIPDDGNLNFCLNLPEKETVMASETKNVEAEAEVEPA